MNSLFLSGSVIDVKKGKTHRENDENRSSPVIVEGTQRQIMATCRPFSRDFTGRSLRQQTSRPRLSHNNPLGFDQPNQADAMGMGSRENWTGQERPGEVPPYLKARGQ